MPCLLALTTFFTPRLVIILVTLFGDHYMGRAYTSILWPLLGFFFMPLTTLGYAWAINWHGQVEGGFFFVVLCAALADLGVVGGGVRLRRLLPF